MTFRRHVLLFYLLILNLKFKSEILFNLDKSSIEFNENCFLKSLKTCTVKNSYQFKNLL